MSILHPTWALLGTLVQCKNVPRTVKKRSRTPPEAHLHVGTPPELSQSPPGALQELSQSSFKHNLKKKTGVLDAHDPEQAKKKGENI